LKEKDRRGNRQKRKATRKVKRNIVWEKGSARGGRERARGSKRDGKYRNVENVEK
jgi:hypothetical protein